MNVTKAEAKRSPGRPRDPSKLSSILDSSLELFLKNGFDGTSMDMIAAHANVSKATVYRHFDNKVVLFRRLVEQSAASALVSFESLTQVANPALGMDAQLEEFACTFAREVVSHEVMGLYRLVVSEAHRLPGLGESFYDLAPRIADARAAALLCKYKDEGLLEFDDPDETAQLFTEMLISTARLKYMIFGAEAVPVGEIERLAKVGLSAFLRAFKVH